MPTQKELRSYARLIAKAGAAPKPGQWVIVMAETDQPEFVALVVEECYRAGAGRVSVEWDYQPLTVIHNRYMSAESLGEVAEWQKAKLEHQCQTMPARIYLVSEDPDGLSGMDMEKHAKAQQLRYPIVKPYRDRMENKYQWVIAAVPGRAWAKKVFPDLTPKKAERALWDAILETSRAKGDAIANWDAHNAEIKARCKKLNDMNLRSLHYTASNGTDFTVGLIENAIFEGGCETLPGTDLAYNPNIPSEEIFTSPMKGEAEGIVYSSKPFSYRGALIENFSIRFEGGKAVEVKAEKGEELLKQMIAMDEGAAYLGEVALVPYESPINQTGILFYNTLFDENAACHLALGAGFTACIKDFDNYSLEQLHEMGINDSMIHEDFMIGTKDLKIVGVGRDGEEYLIFEDGNFAI